MTLRLHCLDLTHTLLGGRDYPMGGCASTPVPSASGSFYELQALDIDKKPVDFAQFRGQARTGVPPAVAREAGWAVLSARHRCHHRPSRRSTHRRPPPFLPLPLPQVVLVCNTASK